MAVQTVDTLTAQRAHTAMTACRSAVHRLPLLHHITHRSQEFNLCQTRVLPYGPFPLLSPERAYSRGQCARTSVRVAKYALQKACMQVSARAECIHCVLRDAGRESAVIIQSASRGVLRACSWLQTRLLRREPLLPYSCPGASRVTWFMLRSHICPAALNPGALVTPLPAEAGRPVHIAL